MIRTDNRFLARFATVTACVYALFAMFAFKVALAEQEGELVEVNPPRPMAQFAYRDGDDNTYSSTLFADSPMLIHFWATWCPPCIGELPEMAKATQEFEKQGLKVVPLSLDRDRKKIADFYAQYNLNLPVMVDPHGETMGKLKIRGVPATVLVDRKGQVVAMQEGVVNWKSDSVRNRLELLLKQQIPSSRSAPESQN